MNEIENEQDAIQIQANAAFVGLFGLALKAFIKDGGKSGALAALDKIESGDAFVKVEVLINKNGMTATGAYCSHNAKDGQNLFNVTLRNGVR